MEAKLENMHLNLQPPKVSESKKKSKEEIAESWDDESISSSASDEENNPDNKPSNRSPTSHHGTHHGRSTLNGAKLPIPNAPPPTPISSEGTTASFAEWPSTKFQSPSISIASSQSNSPRPSRPSTASSGPDAREKRPEKTTATANRLIAGALGLKAPKKTEEQRAYDRAIREAEIKRREREKAEKARQAEEDEKAKASVWDS